MALHCSLSQELDQRGRLALVEKHYLSESTGLLRAAPLGGKEKEQHHSSHQAPGFSSVSGHSTETSSPWIVGTCVCVCVEGGNLRRMRWLPVRW